MKKIIFFLFSSFLLANVNVAMSANLSVLKDELIKEFHKFYPNVKVNTFIGSSGLLVAQISRGAFYDVFLSADKEHPLFLYKKGLAFTKPIVYAKGGIVLFSRKRITFVNNLSKIAIANPKIAPYGKAAIKFLEKIDFPKSRIVYTQNVSQLIFYGLNVVDGVIVPKSSIKVLKYGKSHFYEIPKKFYSPIEQSMVVLRKAVKNKDAFLFFGFILSKPAQEIFKKYGYD
ncbi:MAG: molybdate ABC transporter substrate-binding protein [Nautiliaceae bacterium]